MKLAESVAATGPLASASQREMDRVVQENKDLQARVAMVQSQLDQARSAAFARPPALPTAPNTVPNPISARAAAEARRDETARASAATTAAPRTHTVRKGETPTGIAKGYGISVNALMAANPKYRPNNLPAGAVLNIPAP
jgi:LysM repeat protein